MPRIRKKRVRAVRASRRRSVVTSDISTWDYLRLKRELCGRPALVLEHFKTCQIGSLMELPLFLEILTQTPKIAARIALVAVSMGIPIDGEDPDTGDILATMKPGEV